MFKTSVHKFKKTLCPLKIKIKNKLMLFEEITITYFENQIQNILSLKYTDFDS
jgi:hypothetical protein